MASSQRKVPLRLAKSGKRGRELRYSRVLTQHYCSRSGAVLRLCWYTKRALTSGSFRHMAMTLLEVSELFHTRSHC